MSLSIRILVAWFVLAGLATVLFLNSILNQLPSSVRQASEEVLVDSSNLLAEVAGLHWDQGFAQGSPFAEAVQRYQQRQLDALIWSHHKTRPELLVYLTDSQGRVLFHTDPALIGEDFSNWRDVALTLRGEYGARTTRTTPEDESSSHMYVAAPIYHNDELRGVVALGQPTSSLQPFITLAHGYFWQRGGLILLGALLLGAALSIWITRSIRRLVEYVERVRNGERVSAPRLGERELDRLARATEAMRAEIDGKAYVEQYVHTLTHEMKSPLSAIRGAAELLQEGDVPALARERFLANIDSESQRLQRLVERLLSLASVEKRQHLEQAESLDLAELAARELESKQPLAEKKQLALQLIRTDDCHLRGEAFLLEQAISNLLDNAIEFSLSGGQVTLRISAHAQQLRLTVSNDGPPVPDYAMDRVFERFYSLPRPDGQRKSTGLGLSFVREVAQLHQGSVELRNRPEGGVEVCLNLPRQPQQGRR
ncbi:two-component system sensor histidine kinase CreC [Halopseudomonas salegens]|uniref:histidine kinase n=1 Tax=Halopseudomonas salegens TaxID=1434072 RepID=A0A1H2H1L2_9GAMM|nr:two-component system sensor histidine kinase CreC [Halopseudomonas salegens]SDU25740.1 two-component system, OmpR family, sensor histidine kinase CreC [Halopseudomonas salegens]